MFYSYASCNNLPTAVCGEQVVNFNSAYLNCTKVKEAVMGPNVEDAYASYMGCTDLITPACGNNVKRFSYCYENCASLTEAVCGHNVISMGRTYFGCEKLTKAVFGPNVEEITYAYANCPNIKGNTYLYSNNVKQKSSGGVFYGRNTSNMLNIYVHQGTTSLNSILDTAKSYSLSSKAMTYTNDTANNRYYNTAYNIYIYPVANVEEARINNGD